MNHALRVNHALITREVNLEPRARESRGYVNRSIWYKYKCARPPLHQDWVRARTADSRFARDDKQPGPSWETQLFGERPRETAQTFHTSPRPSRHNRSKGAAPLSGAEEQTARAISSHAQCACLLSLQMGSIN